MNSLDRILPLEILEKINSKHLDLELTLTGVDCCGSWPKCKVLANDIKIFDGNVIREKSIKFSFVFKNVESVVIKIVRYGKTSMDTKIDIADKITDNQILSIGTMKINGVDLIKNNFIYTGKYTMHLSPAQKQYFLDHDIDTENSNYHFYENGEWHLYLEFPILTYIINKRKKLESYELISYQQTLNNIINKLGI